MPYIFFEIYNYHYIKIIKQNKIRFQCAPVLNTMHASFAPIIPPNRSISYQQILKMEIAFTSSTFVPTRLRLNYTSTVAKGKICKRLFHTPPSVPPPPAQPAVNLRKKAY